MTKYRWIEPVEHSLETGLTQFGLVGNVLRARGIRDAEGARAFLENRLTSLPDPSTLPDIAPATDRIRQALEDGERIAVFGDYDVDGVTSTALLSKVLSALGGAVRAYLPHRERDGYGLNLRAVEQAARDGCGLLITVDCGTGNAAELRHAAGFGLDSIVIDHHQISTDHPPAIAFVSPRRADSEHEFAEYAAVGVTYQLLRYLTNDSDMHPYLPLVAVGTVADVVPLTGANRILVHNGLAAFAEHAGPGLRMLAKAAGVHPESITSHHIGFMLGPRINAAGRIDDPVTALDLLMTESEPEAADLAERLNELNRQRQRMLEEAVAQAQIIAEADGLMEKPVLVVHSPDWRIGVVGLVASRLSEQYGRPVFALEQGAPSSRGSARSIDEFNVVTALGRCSDVLEKFGGHSMAAGVTLQTNRIREFADRINDVFIEEIGPDLPRPVLCIDAELDPRAVSLDLVDELAHLEPFGSGNPSPTFLMRGVAIGRVRRSRSGEHLLFNVSRPGQAPLRAVGFGAGDRLAEIGRLSRVDLALSLRANTWQGRTSVTLEVIDFRPAD